MTKINEYRSFPGTDFVNVVVQKLVNQVHMR